MKYLLNLFFIIFAFFCSAATAQTILAFGDSLTHGYGLPENKGLVPQLERHLNQRGYDVDIINAGVSGDTTTGGLERIEWSLTSDVDIVLLALGGNDALRAMEPKLVRSNLEKIIEIVLSKNLKVVFVGTYAPHNYGNRWKAEFDNIFPDLAAKYDIPLVDSYFSAIMDANNPDIEKTTQFLQSDLLHPNSEGVRRIVNYISPWVIDAINNTN